MEKIKFSSSVIMKSLALLVLLAVASSSSLKFNDRIVGGSNAAVDSAPYIVSLEEYGYGGYLHYCSGSIINENWILSAAHCITNSALASKTTIFAGCIDILDPMTNCIARTIATYVNNDLYVGGTNPYDIALIQVNEPYQWTSSVSPVGLPDAGIIPSGDAELYGWGDTSSSPTSSYPDILQTVVLPTITIEECENSYGTIVHSTNVCAGPLSGGTSICSADSGGPLVQTISGVTTLIGIVSWGNMPCGQPDSPSVFTRVSAFNTWISQNQE